MKSTILNFPIYHVNAFTSHLFAGNPAVVCLLPYELPDSVLQQLAKEHAQPVTVFLIQKQEHVWAIRWLTPEIELNLCGHGSLAAGCVLSSEIETTGSIIHCESPQESFTITCQADLLTLDFPAQTMDPVDIPEVAEALGGPIPLAVYQYQQQRCVVIYENELAVRLLQPDFKALKALTYRGIVVTAQGDNVDFVSRTFYPGKSTPEDAVTGSSHCLLAPYWSKQLQKTDLHALQISQRGGELFCCYANDRVQLSGYAIIYSRGLAQIKI